MLIDYTLNKTYSEDVKVYVRPFSDGAIASGYGASGRDVILGNSGSESAYFTINRGEAHIDAIRFQIVDDASGDLLLQEVEVLRF